MANTIRWEHGDDGWRRFRTSRGERRVNRADDTGLARAIRDGSHTSGQATSHRC